MVDCVDCHLPRIVKSAVGNADGYTGDIRAHLWAIDPEATSQFSEDGSATIAQVTLDFFRQVLPSRRRVGNGEDGRGVESRSYRLPRPLTTYVREDGK